MSFNSHRATLIKLCKPISLMRKRLILIGLLFIAGAAKAQTVCHRCDNMMLINGVVLEDSVSKIPPAYLTFVKNQHGVDYYEFSDGTKSLLGGEFHLVRTVIGVYKKRVFALLEYFDKKDCADIIKHFSGPYALGAEPYKLYTNKEEYIWTGILVDVFLTRDMTDTSGCISWKSKKMNKLWKEEQKTN